MNNSHKNNNLENIEEDPRLLALAEKVMATRITRGYSQSKLAEKSGLPQSQVSKIERALIQEPGIWTLQNLAEALDLSLADLLTAPVLDKKDKKKLPPLDWDKIDKDRPLIVPITSPKGGIGKSSTAVNLAALLAKSSKENLQERGILVIDGDFSSGRDFLNKDRMELDNGWVDLMRDFKEGEVVDPADLYTLLQYSLLLPKIKDVQRAGDVNNPYLQVLPSTCDAIDLFEKEREDEENFKDSLEPLLLALGKHYSVIIVDLPFEIWSGHVKTFMKLADIMIFLTNSEKSTVEKTRKAISYLENKLGFDRDKLILLQMRADVELGGSEEFEALIDELNIKNLEKLNDHAKEVDRSNNKGTFLSLEPGFKARKYQAQLYSLIARISKLIR